MRFLEVTISCGSVSGDLPDFPIANHVFLQKVSFWSALLTFSPTVFVGAVFEVGSSPSTKSDSLILESLDGPEFFPVVFSGTVCDLPCFPSTFDLNLSDGSVAL